jgi:hypothetical protein
MQSYGGARTGAGQRSVVLAFSKQSMTDDDDDQESIGRRPKRAALTVVVLGFFAQNHLVVQLVRRTRLMFFGVRVRTLPVPAKRFCNGVLFYKRLLSRNQASRWRLIWTGTE